MATPTDDELERIQADGEQYEMDRDQYANNAEIDNAGRRALYEAGYAAGYKQGVRDSHKVDVAWLLTDEAAWPLVSLVVEGSDHTVSNRDALWDVKSALKTLHARITGGGQ